ncbi:hypothetical protein [Paenibacillus larvae]|uniref:hypothetical protein n=1 Tax=Paenibacillus larvae TaxID=1464 RepID=UPI0018DE6912|nr:hypothetical protein [Paenibacillus larvae]
MVDQTGSISVGQTLNRYAYVNGNPVSYADPFGLSRDSDTSPYAHAANFVLDFPVCGIDKRSL